jgi:glycosyltransferase involved in cell wall biosynthesis
MEPLISVYIPTYNRLELLKRAVQSVQNQTYKNFEIIIVDDNSSDGTQDFLVGLAKVDSRICYFFKDKNSGACVSRNIAINLAQGELITGLDDDDYFLPHRLEFFLDYWVNKREKTQSLYLPQILKVKK